MAESLADLAARIRGCTLCRLHEGRTRAVPGEGPERATLFLVGEGPGRNEDESGLPFVGAAGRILDAALSKAGIARDEVFVTNAVKCHPPDNRKPRADEVTACRPYLLAQIDAVRPGAVVTLGDTALKALLGAGLDLPAARRRRRLLHGAVPVIPTYHPAAARYNRGLVATITKDLGRASRAARAPARIRSGRPRASKPTRPAVSSGCAILNAEGRVLLLRRADEGVWCLPKGTLEPGETERAAAVREVREESGLEVRIVAPLAEVRYGFYSPEDDMNVDKRVVYFLAERIGGRLSLEPGFDDARWCTRAEALRLLHYENDRDVVAAAFRASEGPTGRTRGRGRGASS